MRLVQLTQLAVTLLLFSFPVGDRPAYAALSPSRQKGPQKTPSEKAAPQGSKEKATQQPSPQTATQQAPSQENTKAGPAGSWRSETRESFSQLTLFLFASGQALFVALLGWSDQIRGIDKDTRELESRFLRDTGIAKRDFLRVVKPHSPDERIQALTQLMNSGRIKTAPRVELLATFRRWNREWSQLEKLSAWKYNLTIALTIALFIAGGASLFTTSSQSVRLHFISIRIEMLVLVLPMTLIGGLLCIVIYGAQREKALRALLTSMDEMV